MCDTAVRVEPGRVLFAKNSDRDANESQLLDWQPARTHAANATLACTWLHIPQARETHAVLLSRPFWMWGAEMGANAHGLVIGNEAVFTRAEVPEQGLTGMDLVRLALERATSVHEAVDVITRLIARHGQGGGCGYEERSFRYHSSFLIADPEGAIVLETAEGGACATERVEGARSISNGFSLEPFGDQHAHRELEELNRCGVRRARSEQLAAQAGGPGDMMALLRDHGAGRAAPHYDPQTGAMSAPCMHAGGELVNSRTTGSWVSELRADGMRHWATATANPCSSLFKPVAVDAPLQLAPVPGAAADESLWWRWERLGRRVARDPERLLPLFAGERDALEASWLAAPPDPGAAFTEGETRLTAWEAAVAAESGQDRRPGFAQAYWKVRNEAAGLRF